MAGRIDATISSFISMQPHIAAGRLKLLAIGRATRSPKYPQYPTIAETLPGYEVDALQGLVAPAAVPAAIVDQLAGAIREILRLPDVQQRLGADGGVLVGSTPREFKAYLATEMVKWARVVKQSGARPD
jgi:tripartite-type tricarboxylate transporter receptor subunit TctC